MPVKISEVREGTILLADAGFSCIELGTTRTVQKDLDGRLFVYCAEDKHYLEGQRTENGRYIGFELVSSEPRYKERYTARPCQCGHSSCKHWHVWPVAAYQGVGFTEKQARAVADLLNRMEDEAS